MESARAGSGVFTRVLLVGFMGSGKSTVGALLAARLGWSFLDFDDEIERKAGASVEEIFRTKGEAYFRALESEVGRELLEAERAVLAAGGGWAAAPGRMDVLPVGTLSVWLDVGSATALGRVAGDVRARPLLQGSDPAARAEALLRERRVYYKRASLRIAAGEASPGKLVDEIIEHMEVRGSDGA